MNLTERQRNSIENIIRGAMLPVAVGGFIDIEIHAPGAVKAIEFMLAEGDEEGQP